MGKNKKENNKQEEWPEIPVIKPLKVILYKDDEIIMEADIKEEDVNDNGDIVYIP